MPSAEARPNVLLILADDMGYSDLGCFGGEIRTPHIDSLGRAGVRFTQFYNTARCSPSRASLLTGLHPHSTGVGILAKDDRPGGYAGSLDDRCVTLAEELGAAGYRTGLSGKWHLSAEVHHPSDSWPTRRGFEHVYGTITGCGSYYRPGTLVRGEEPAESDFAEDPDWYLTEAIGEDAARFVAEDDERPFFLYLAFTAPHWPLHAKEDEVEAYDGVFASGWDDLRAARHQRMLAEGILPPGTPLSPADPEGGVPWRDAEHKDWEQRRMQTYAAMVESMDRQIGRVVDELKRAGRFENTIILFLSDNGGCAEYLPHGPLEEFSRRSDIVPSSTRDGRPMRIGNFPDIEPGVEESYMSYGQSWANLSNTPFRFFKRWVHEGGISTPLIVHWAGGGLESGIVCAPFQLTDVYPTLLELAGLEADEKVGDTRRLGAARPSLPGRSFASALRGGVASEGTLYWEHIGNCAIRHGSYKLVKETHGDWELYDIEADRVELHDLAADRPDLVADLAERWQRWADEVGVIPWEETVRIYEERGLSEFEAFS
ncbi:arylsulfatase [Microbacterium oryzae]|uniref:arylsulfatase n=1 Tax=Microbacterium oryzae TaxID=743009 RepID=UPI0025B0FCA1|nr:arylsulfatase [Microbacterium oryzae]MDN3311606.1 arylsulfatase [Microbacterium oryzae]